MTKKRWWIALVAIPICLISVFLVSAQRSRQANAGGVIDPTCTSSSPCIEYDNNGSGPGVRGVGLLGNGVGGQTKFNSTSSSNGKAAVAGADVSSTGTFNSGVKGTSTRGTGVSGLSATGAGVAGQSTSGDAVFGTSTNLAGVHGFSTTNNGVFGDSTGSGASGVYGQNDGGGYGVAGRITKPGIAAVLADGGFNGVGAFITGGYTNSVGTNFPALAVAWSGTSNQIIDACGGNIPCSGAGNDEFTLDTHGNVVITGTITTAGSCHTGCISASASSEKRVRFYTPQESLPTVEDFGEAQLINGQAYVRIDPAFASTIDPTAAYMVFITPEGPSRGLYVTQKSTTGFAVRENPGGNSSLSFSYRIVAKPYGEHPVRLQVITTVLPRTPTRSNRSDLRQE